MDPIVPNRVRPALMLRRTHLFIGLRRSFARLRDLRLGRGLTLRGLAEQSHVAYRSVVLIEQGHHQPSAQSIRRLSAVLDVSPLDVTEFAMTLQGAGR